MDCPSRWNPNDEPTHCEVCGAYEDACDCPECERCGEVGALDCYVRGHLPAREDSIEAFCDHIGIEPVLSCLRAIDKYGSLRCELELPGGHRIDYEKQTSADGVSPYARLAWIHLSGIAWDGSDWEWSSRVKPGDWDAYYAAEQDYQDALAEHKCEMSNEVFLEIRDSPLGDLDQADLEEAGLEGWTLVKHARGLCLCSPGTSAEELGYPDHSGQCLGALLSSSIKEELT